MRYYILLVCDICHCRTAEARQVAVSGFLTILKHCKVIGGLPMSQLSQSSMVLALTQVVVDVWVILLVLANI